MQKLLATAGKGLLLCALVSCAPAPGEQLQTPAPPSQLNASASSAPASSLSTFEGRLDKAGISIYMEGTHRLSTDDGGVVLLESATVDLDQYLDKKVRVTGDARPTVEQGGTLVRVQTIEQLPDDNLPRTETGAMPQSSSSAAEEALSSSAESSSAVSSAAPKASSSKAAARSLAASTKKVSSSAAAASTSSAGPLTDTQRRTDLMAKSKADAANFTQEYCSTHVGFCVPLHHNWFYYSFGTTSSYLWHVEVSSDEIENLGDGPLVLNLVSGDLPSTASDESISDRGEYVIGYRAWTNNRHFEVTAPAKLRTAVQYIVSNLAVYHDQDASSASARSSNSSATESGGHL